MQCPTCRGRRYALCPECQGSGIASCCDTAGSYDPLPYSDIGFELLGKAALRAFNAMPREDREKLLNGSYKFVIDLYKEGKDDKGGG